MIKIDIMNMKSFLQTVNECGGAIYWRSPDGKKVDINKQYGIQYELMRVYANQGDFLRIALDIPNPSDYFRIVYYAIGGY